MQNKLRLTVFMQLIILISSCMTSLYPVTTYKNIITDNRIEGIWNYKDLKFTIGKIPDTILRKELNGWTSDKLQRYYDSILFYSAYGVDLINNGYGYQFDLYLTLIQNNIFVDISPGGFEPHIDQEMWQKKYLGKLEYLPTYTIARLEINNDSTIILHFLNGSFIKSQVDQGKIKIKHEEDKIYDMFLVTASSEELQKYISKYGDDERLYDIENRIVLKRTH